MRITSKGQVTIPNEYRIKYGLLPHTLVEFKSERGKLCIVHANETKKTSRGKQIIQRMRSVEVNRNMSTKEILKITRGYSEDDK